MGSSCCTGAAADHHSSQQSSFKDRSGAKTTPVVPAEGSSASTFHRAHSHRDTAGSEAAVDARTSSGDPHSSTALSALHFQKPFPSLSGVASKGRPHSSSSATELVHSPLVPPSVRRPTVTDGNSNNSQDSDAIAMQGGGSGAALVGSLRKHPNLSAFLPVQLSQSELTSPTGGQDGPLAAHPPAAATTPLPPTSSPNTSALRISRINLLSRTTTMGSQCSTGAGGAVPLLHNAASATPRESPPDTRRPSAAQGLSSVPPQTPVALMSVKRSPPPGGAAASTVRVPMVGPNGGLEDAWICLEQVEDETDGVVDCAAIAPLPMAPLAVSNGDDEGLGAVPFPSIGSPLLEEDHRGAGGAVAPGVQTGPQTSSISFSDAESPREGGPYPQRTEQEQQEAHQVRHHRASVVSLQHLVSQDVASPPSIDSVSLAHGVVPSSMTPQRPSVPLHGVCISGSSSNYHNKRGSHKIQSKTSFHLSTTTNSESQRNMSPATFPSASWTGGASTPVNAITGENFTNPAGVSVVVDPRQQQPHPPPPPSSSSSVKVVPSSDPLHFSSPRFPSTTDTAALSQRKQQNADASLSVFQSNVSFPPVIGNSVLAGAPLVEMAAASTSSAVPPYFFPQYSSSMSLHHPQGSSTAAAGAFTKAQDTAQSGRSSPGGRDGGAPPVVVETLPPNVKTSSIAALVAGANASLSLGAGGASGGSGNSEPGATLLMPTASGGFRSVPVVPSSSSASYNGPAVSHRRPQPVIISSGLSLRRAVPQVRPSSLSSPTVPIAHQMSSVASPNHSRGAASASFTSASGVPYPIAFPPTSAGGAGGSCSSDMGSAVLDARQMRLHGVLERYIHDQQQQQQQQHSSPHPLLQFNASAGSLPSVHNHPTGRSLASSQGAALASGGSGVFSPASGLATAAVEQHGGGISPHGSSLGAVLEHHHSASGPPRNASRGALSQDDHAFSSLPPSSPAPARRGSLRTPTHGADFDDTTTTHATSQRGDDGLDEASLSSDSDDVSSMISASSRRKSRTNPHLVAIDQLRRQAEAERSAKQEKEPSPAPPAVGSSATHTTATSAGLRFLKNILGPNHNTSSTGDAATAKAATENGNTSTSVPPSPAPLRSVSSTTNPISLIAPAQLQQMMMLSSAVLRNGAAPAQTVPPVGASQLPSSHPHRHSHTQHPTAAVTTTSTTSSATNHSFVDRWVVENQVEYGRGHHHAVQ